MSTASAAFSIPDGDRFIATPHGRGPWTAHHLHAGPPAALLARATADDPALMVTRLTLELMAPVPEGAVEVATSVLRSGRSTRRLEATLSAGGRVAVRPIGVVVRHEPRVCLEAVTTPEPNGIGSRLFDRRGPIGVSVQGLLLARR